MIKFSIDTKLQTQNKLLMIVIRWNVVVVVYGIIVKFHRVNLSTNLFFTCLVMS